MDLSDGASFNTSHRGINILKTVTYKVRRTAYHFQKSNLSLLLTKTYQFGCDYVRRNHLTESLKMKVSSAAASNHMAITTMPNPFLPATEESNRLVVSGKRLDIDITKFSRSLSEAEIAEHPWRTPIIQHDEILPEGDPIVAANMSAHTFIDNPMHGRIIVSNAGYVSSSFDIKDMALFDKNNNLQGPQQASEIVKRIVAKFGGSISAAPTRLSQNEFESTIANADSKSSTIEILMANRSKQKAR